MADSDKLIINEAEAVECLKSNKPTIGYVMLKESIDMAIHILEKQIPKKPKERDCIGFYTLACPVCKCALYLYEPYCDNCGQKLDWSDE